MSLVRVVTLGLAGVGGCAVDPIDLADRQCDDEHPCAAEYTCVDNVCERTDELDDAADTSG